MMSTINEIKKLEAELVQAELGPDAAFFKHYLADDAIMDGQKMKEKIVAAHQPDGSAKFAKVEMKDMKIVDFGNAAVVTCVGVYEGPKWSGELKFMRVWLKTAQGWQIITGTTS